MAAEEVQCYQNVIDSPESDTENIAKLKGDDIWDVNKSAQPSSRK